MHRLLALSATVVSLLAAGPAAAQAAAPASSSTAHCPPASTSSSTAAQLHAMYCLVNATRRSAGLPALRTNRTLERAARIKAARIGACGQFTHEPCGAPFTQAFRAAGWRRATMGENIAYGTSYLGSPRAILRSWMASPGHRANLLRRGFRFQGLAVRTVTLPGVGRARLWANAFGG